jgi:hypothetical protein
MLIRDYGDIVEFWITSANSTTFTDHLPWGWTINGSTGNATYNYPAGGDWRRLGNYLVTTSQDVTFRIGSTGTSGFGGPTTFTVHINRQTVPPAPSVVTLSQITSTSMVGSFTSNGDGQSQIFEWTIGYGTDPNTPQFFNSSGLTAPISGLSSGVTYYFWARGRNALGWGPYGPRSSATTLRVPDAPSPPVVSPASQTSLVADFSQSTIVNDGGSPVTLFETGYTTSPTGNPTTSLTGSSPITFVNLQPATTYYVKLRAKNAIGWSPWSTATVSRTIAGARVKSGGVWKEAIPYVRVSGVWKLARPWLRDIGIWKETI